MEGSIQVFKSLLRTKHPPLLAMNFFLLPQPSSPLSQSPFLPILITLVEWLRVLGTYLTVVFDAFEVYLFSS